MALSSAKRPCARGDANLKAPVTPSVWLCRPFRPHPTLATLHSSSRKACRSSRKFRNLFRRWEEPNGSFPPPHPQRSCGHAGASGVNTSHCRPPMPSTSTATLAVVVAGATPLEMADTRGSRACSLATATPTEQRPLGVTPTQPGEHCHIQRGLLRSGDVVGHTGRYGRGLRRRFVDS